MTTAHKLIALIFISVALFTKALCAQDALPEAPALDTAETGVGGVAPGLPVSPDDGTLRSSAAEPLATFGIGRRLHLSGSVTGGYDDNINTTPTDSPSWFISPNAVFSYEFGNERLAFTVITGAGITYYFDHPGGRDYDPNLNLRFIIAYKASPRLTLTVSGNDAYQSQPDYTTDLNVNRHSGNHFRAEEHIAASYRLSPRLTSVTSYSFGLLISDGSSIAPTGTSTSASNGVLNSASDDQIRNIFGEQLRYLLFPTTTATADYSYGITEHVNTPIGSTTQTFALGADQSFSPRLTARLKGGLQLRLNDNGGQNIAPYLQSDIRYLFGSTLPTVGSGVRLGGSTQQLGSFVSWSNGYSFEESDLPGGQGRETYRSNLEFSYPVTDRITASLALVYLHGINQGSNAKSGISNSSSEDVIDIAPTLRYAVNQRLSVVVGYRHTELDRGSNTSTRFSSEDFGYVRSRYYAGVTLTY